MIRVVLTLALIASCASGPSLTPAATSQPVPELAFPLLGGNTWSTAAARGTVIVVDIWATYCKPCKDAFPRLGRLAQAHPEITVIGLSVDEDDEVVRRYLEDVPAAFPIARDRSLRVQQPPINVSALPTLIVVDKVGRVRFRRDDAKLSDYDALPALIDALVAER